MAAQQTDWDYYLTQVEGKPAAISLDLALADEAPFNDKPWLLWVSIKIQSPDKDGFASVTESETLSIIEDALATQLDIIGAILAGSLKSNGLWDLYFYAPTNEEFDDIVLEIMEGYAEYEFATDANEDPEWDEYLGNLYPEYYDFQCMLNRRVTDTLLEEGDNTQIKRPIDHVINFENELGKSAFLREVEQLGYASVALGDTEKDPAFPWALRISRNDNTVPDELNASIWALCQLAERYHGHYDGWGCEVAK